MNGPERDINAGHGESRRDHRQRILIVAVSVIAVLLVGQALRSTYFVTMPLVFAFFVAVVVYPVHHKMKGRLPGKLKWLGVVVSFFAMAAVLSAFVGALWYAIDRVAEGIPQYSGQLESHWQTFIQWLNRLNIPIREDLTEYEAIRTRLGELVSFGLQTAQGLIAAVVLIVFFVLLMLIETDRWERKIQHGFSEARSRQVLDVFYVLTHKVRWYLLVKTGLGLLAGVSEGLWLWSVGVDFAILWGLLIFLLSYVPIIGAFIAIIPPALFAIVQLGFGGALLAIGGVVLIEQIISNFLEPLLEGFALRLSPVVVLLSVALWSWIWGVPGAILAVPLTVTAAVILAHYRSTQPLALLLSNTSDMDKMLETTHNHKFEAAGPSHA